MKKVHIFNPCSSITTVNRKPNDTLYVAVLEQIFMLWSSNNFNAMDTILEHLAVTLVGSIK